MQMSTLVYDRQSAVKSGAINELKERRERENSQRRGRERRRERKRE